MWQWNDRYCNIPRLFRQGVITGCLCSLVWAIQMYVGSLKYSSRIGYNMAPLYMENFTVEVTYTPRHQTPSVFTFRTINFNHAIHFRYCKLYHNK